MPTCCSAPRSISAMNGSPAICSENRVQRAQSTQRSRSSSTCAEMLIGLGKVRLVSVKRVSPRPLVIAWFCSGHSPPLSQTGQSSGWLISRNSMIALLRLVGDRRGDLGVDHHALGDRRACRRPAACGHGRRPLPASAHLDQALPAGADRGEQRVVAEPRDLHADLLGGADHQGALGHAHLDVVDGQRDQVGLLRPRPACWSSPSCARSARWRRGWRRPGRTGSRRARSARRTRRGSTGSRT